MLGAVNGAIVCILVTLFAVTLPVLGDDQKTAICQSKSGYWIAQGIGQIHVGLPEDIHNVVHPYLHGLREKIEEVHGSAETNGEEGGDHDHAEDDEKGDWNPSDSQRTARSLLDQIDNHFQSDRR